MNENNSDMQQANILMALANLRRQVKSGAKNFYWIAALSVINSVVALFDGTVSFVIGLGLTQIIDGLVLFLAEDISEASATIRIFGLIFSVTVSGLFAAFGFFGGKGHRWAFWVGMVLYALDGLLMFIYKDWLGFGFHLFLLWGLFNGLKAVGKLQSILPQTPVNMPFPKDIGYT